MALSKNTLTWLEPVQQPLPVSSPWQKPLSPIRGRSIVVHEFTMGDVDDPDLYASQPLWEFQESEKGQWVMEHALETPIWQREHDYVLYGYRYKIAARLSEPDITYFLLRWS